MITAGDFRKGVTFEMDGNIYLVVDFLHVKPGKGSPFVRAKIKNIVTGQVLERTFNPSDKFQVAVIERKEMQYLYKEGEIFYFMDMETYDHRYAQNRKLEHKFRQPCKGRLFPHMFQFALIFPLFLGKVLNSQNHFP